MRVLVTGATGYIGRAVVDNMLLRSKYEISLLMRKESTGFPSENIRVHQVRDMEKKKDWVEELRDVDVIIHLAGRAHVLSESADDPISAFRAVNVEATLNLASQALEAGVKRFVFISSIGVNGSVTDGQPFSETSPALPQADYAVSKSEAEQGLWRIVEDGGMDLTIIRPPLVYSAYAPGNFGKLLKLVSSGLPLPLALVRNQRSMVALENLVDFICVCVEHPAAANQTFLISDGVDFSTAEIVKILAEGMGRKIYLLPMPVGLMRLSFRLMGKKTMCDQLLGSLVVDSSKAYEFLGWKPIVDANSALKEAGLQYSRRKL